MAGRTEKERTLLNALACGATIESAARKAELGVRTVYRRLRNPAFQKQLQNLRLDMVQRTSAMLTGAGMTSVKALVDLVQDGGATSAVRRRAARDILELGMTFRERSDLEQRLAALEERVAAQDCTVGEANKKQCAPHSEVLLQPGAEVYGEAGEDTTSPQE